MKDKIINLICHIYGFFSPSTEFLRIREGDMYRIYAVKNSYVPCGTKGGLACHKSTIKNSWLCILSKLHESCMDNSSMDNSRMNKSSMYKSHMTDGRMDNSRMSDSSMEATNSITNFVAFGYKISVTDFEERIVAGCWNGTFGEFKAQKAEKYGDKPEFNWLCQAIQSWLDMKKISNNLNS